MAEQRAQLAQRLAAGITALGLDLDSEVQGRLLDYVELLAKWNRAYNLTAIRDPLEMVTRHLLDSLSVAPHLQGERVIDVGSGGGLPGIPLAILFPARHFTLLDSNGKKTRFLIQAKAQLGLDNMEVVHARVEDYRPGQRYDCVITRAFASVADILIGSRHLVTPQGELAAMKGMVPQQELEALPGGCRLIEAIPLQVPGLEQEQRHLLRFTCEADSGSE